MTRGDTPGPNRQESARVEQSKPSGGARLVHVAFAAYWLSYAMPAIMLAGDHMFGFTAARLSLTGLRLMGRLEAGQGPACLLGVLANSSMILGYAAFCWRRWSGKIGPYRVASWLAALGAIFAFGSAVFLATGAEAFMPNIGYFVWLASMVVMSIACRNSGLKSRGRPPAND